jgi:hypothetical protein
MATEGHPIYFPHTDPNVMRFLNGEKDHEAHFFARALLAPVRVRIRPGAGAGADAAHPR